MWKGKETRRGEERERKKARERGSKWEIHRLYPFILTLIYLYIEMKLENKLQLNSAWDNIDLECINVDPFKKKVIGYL